MTRIFLFHCSGGSPESHWYPWLKRALEKRGDEVIIPTFPIGPHEQTFDNWLKVLEPHKEKLDGSVLIGHSLGAPFILDVLNEWRPHVRATILVAGFVGALGGVDEPNLDDFAERKLDWNRIRSCAERFIVIHGDDDPIVPLQKARELGRLLGTGTEPLIIAGGGHLRGADGYVAFPKLLELIDTLTEK